MQMSVTDISRCWFKRWTWSWILVSSMPFWTCSHLRTPASWAQNRRFADNRVFWFLQYLCSNNVNDIHIIKIYLFFWACAGGAVWVRSGKHKDGTKQCLCCWQLSHQPLWVFSHFPHQGLSGIQCVKTAKVEALLPGKSFVAQPCLSFCSCTWVSPWAPEERTVWSRSEKMRSFLLSHSTCCWRASVPRLQMCRTLSSSMTAPESQNAIVYFLALMIFSPGIPGWPSFSWTSSFTPLSSYSGRSSDIIPSRWHVHICTKSKNLVMLWLEAISEGIHLNYRLTCFCRWIFQAIKQMYVLVLGLDVLGNPFGLIRGLSEGFEAFFYEPYQVENWTIIYL